jgi:hypothetical protein
LRTGFYLGDDGRLLAVSRHIANVSVGLVPRKPPDHKPAPRRKAASAKAPDLYALGARVVSVFGPFNNHVLIEMPASVAKTMFPEPFAASARTSVIEAAMHDMEAIRMRDAELADSALAASAVALAYEIENPYNSATSKSMCARELRDTMDRLVQLAPQAKPKDRVDDLAKRREDRRSTATAN